MKRLTWTGKIISIGGASGSKGVTIPIALARNLTRKRYKFTVEEMEPKK